MVVTIQWLLQYNGCYNPMVVAMQWLLQYNSCCNTMCAAFVVSLPLFQGKPQNILSAVHQQLMNCDVVEEFGPFHIEESRHPTSSPTPGRQEEGKEEERSSCRRGSHR